MSNYLDIVRHASSEHRSKHKQYETSLRSDRGIRFLPIEPLRGIDIINASPKWGFQKIHEAILSGYAVKLWSPRFMAEVLLIADDHSKTELRKHLDEAAVYTLRERHLLLRSKLKPKQLEVLYWANAILGATITAHSESFQRAHDITTKE